MLMRTKHIRVLQPYIHIKFVDIPTTFRKVNHIYLPCFEGRVFIFYRLVFCILRLAWNSYLYTHNNSICTWIEYEGDVGTTQLYTRSDVWCSFRWSCEQWTTHNSTKMDELMLANLLYTPPVLTCHTYFPVHSYHRTIYEY